jgi:prephenate dehydrogenase
MFTRAAIVGCGLIGGSFALALRAAGEVTEVVVFDRDAGSAERARELGIADRVEPALRDAIAGADLVMLAVPVARTRDVLAALAPCLGPDTLVTDVGSTKRSVIDDAREALGPAVARFVPGHPITGGSVHGPDAAQVDLFRNKRVLLTPLPENDESDVARIEAAWRACGAQVDRIDAATHDAVLSSVSHLPHLLAYALVAQIADAPDADFKFSLSGGGFRDFTRIAASSPEMWRDVTLANRDALLKDLDAYRASLDRLRQWVATRDADALEALFTRASEARTRLYRPR